MGYLRGIKSIGIKSHENVTDFMHLHARNACLTEIKEIAVP